MRRASPSSRRFRFFTYEHRFPPSAYSITRWILLELSAFVFDGFCCGPSIRYQILQVSCS